jgi:hypothetical protein
MSHLPYRETTLDEVIKTSGSVWRMPPKRSKYWLRYQVLGVSGYAVRGPTSSTRGHPPVTTFVVLDRYDMWREVARFTPSGGQGLSSADSQRKAQEMCDRLNAEERRENAAQSVKVPEWPRCVK